MASDGLWLQKIIVKAGGKVITIELSANALSVCTLKEVYEFAVDGLTHGGDCSLVRASKRNKGTSS
jgi:hypothetical protein